MMANHPRTKSQHRAPARGTRMVLIVFISLCLVFVASYTSRLLTKSSIEAEIRQYQEKIDTGKREQLLLQAELTYIATDDYIDEVARNELHMAKEGDTVVVVLDSTPAAPATQPAVEIDAEQQERPFSARETPIWQQWFGILSADR